MMFFLHRLWYGHWPVELTEDDGTVIPGGCGLCYLYNPSAELSRLHNSMRYDCPKQLLGYSRECRGTDREHGL